MPEDQEAIYVILGQSVDAVAKSPHLEGLRAKGYEVLYLTDPIDEWVLSSLDSFDEKPLVSAETSGFSSKLSRELSTHSSMGSVR